MTKRSKRILPNSLLYLLGRWLFSAFSLTVFRTYTRLVIKDRSLLPKEPFIICSNHQSHLDAIILAHIGSYNFSRTAMIAAKDYWYDDDRRFYFSRLFFNIIPISRRDESDDFSIRQVGRISQEFLSKKGRCVVILPEGTRSKNGEIKPFKKGINLLSSATNLPVVPVYIRNSRGIWPKGSFYMKPGKVEIQVGQPISAKALKSSDDPDLIQNSVIELGEMLK